MSNGVTFQIKSESNLADTFGGAPAPAKAFFRRGGSVLSKVPPDKYQELIRAAAESLSSPHLSSTIVRELATTFKINEQDTPPLLGIASMLVAIITRRQDTVQEVMRAAQEGQFLEPADVSTAAAFAQAILQDRKTVALAVERARIGVEVLPSFESLMTTTDVRLGFDKDRISVAVPVVVAYIDTDSEAHLRFQLTKGQLERLIGQLENAKRELEAAEQWIDKSSKGSVPNV